MIVIPVAVEPRNPTIDFALASIARHAPQPVALVGHLPEHASHGLDVIHIPTVQGSDKYRNTDLAMRTACESSLVPDPFIWSNDDIYWLHPAMPVRWAIGLLEDATGTSNHARRKRQAATLLHRLGYPTWDYEAHVPMLIHKAAMLKALDTGGDKRSVYGNLTGLPDHVGSDVKLRTVEDRLVDASWASTVGDPTRWPELMRRLGYVKTA